MKGILIYILYSYDQKYLVFENTYIFFKELFWKIAKWTKKKCPKCKNQKKFFRKKRKKTILLERCRKKYKNADIKLPT